MQKVQDVGFEAGLKRVGDLNLEGQCRETAEETLALTRLKGASQSEIITVDRGMKQSSRLLGSKSWYHL